MSYKLFTLILFYYFSIGYSQSNKAENILSIVKDNYEKNIPYKINIEYKYAEKVSDNNQIISKKGKIIVDKNLYYSKIDKIEQLYIDNKIITLDNNNKLVYYNNSNRNINNFIFNFNLLYKYYKINKVSEDDDNWIIELKVLDKSELAFDKIIYIINKRTYQVKEERIYFPKFQLKSEGVKKKYTVLTVVFSKLQKLSSDDKKYISSIKKYIHIYKGKVYLDKYLTNKKYKLIK